MSSQVHAVFNEPNSLTEKEAAAYLRTSLSTLRRRRHDRREPAYVQLDRSIRYRKQVLDKFLDDHTQVPDSPESDERSQFSAGDKNTGKREQ